MKCFTFNLCECGYCWNFVIRLKQCLVAFPITIFRLKQIRDTRSNKFRFIINYDNFRLRLSHKFHFTSRFPLPEFDDERVKIVSGVHF
jgi:hypothetical protein